MYTLNLFEKAFATTYSHRMNAYVKGIDLAKIYAAEMKKYCAKRGCKTDYNDLFVFACERLGVSTSKFAA